MAADRAARRWVRGLARVVPADDPDLHIGPDDWYVIPRSGASTRNATAKASSNATLATVRRPKVDVESRTLGLDRNTEACSSRPGSAPPEIPLIALLGVERSADRARQSLDRHATYIVAGIPRRSSTLLMNPVSRADSPDTARQRRLWACSGASRVPLCTLPIEDPL